MRFQLIDIWDLAVSGDVLGFLMAVAALGVAALLVVVAARGLMRARRRRIA